MSSVKISNYSLALLIVCWIVFEIQYVQLIYLLAMFLYHIYNYVMSFDTSVASLIDNSGTCLN